MGTLYNEPIDIVEVFKSEKRIRCFFGFFMTQMIEMETLYEQEEIKMCPIVSATNGSKFELIVIDFNFFIQAILRFLHRNNVKGYENIIGNFGVVGEKGNKNVIKNNKFLISILENYWNIVYLNGPMTQKKSIKYAMQFVYKNDNGSMHFSGIMFVKSSLKEMLNDEFIYDGLVKSSEYCNAKQVAFGTHFVPKDKPNCETYWKESDEEKQIFIETNDMGVE